MNIIQKKFKIELASYILMTIFILSAFVLNLVPALVAGLLIYLLITSIFNGLKKKVGANANRVTILILAAIVASVISLITFAILNSVSYGTDGITSLANETFRIVAELKNYLPESWLALIPQDMIVIKEKVVEVVKENVLNIFAVTASSFKIMTQMFLGMIVGAIIAFCEVDKEHKAYRPLANEIMNRIHVFKECFSKLIVSQIKISAINTTLTAIYLIVVLPIFGVDMPYKTTLLIVTFICGLIPVIGGIISNSLIIILSLTIGIKVVIASVVFLFLVNLSEYYTNAKIVGGEMNTTMWELLIAMIVMEVIFGIWGVVLAPVIYGYIKQELKMKNLV